MRWWWACQISHEAHSPLPHLSKTIAPTPPYSSSSKTTDATTAENDDGDEDVAGQPEEVSFESDYPTIGDALDAADEPQEQDTTADDATESGAEQLDTAAAVENEDSAPVINEDATTSDPLPASSTGESQDPTPNAYPEETEAQADKEVATATDADDVEFIDDTESLTAQQQDESGQEDATPLDAEEAANETPDASAAVEEHTSAEALDVAPEDEDAHEVQGQNGTMEVELEAEGAAQGEDDGTELEVEAEEEEAEVKKVRRTDSHAAAQRMVKVTVRPARGESVPDDCAMERLPHEGVHANSSNPPFLLVPACFACSTQSGPTRSSFSASLDTRPLVAGLRILLPPLSRVYSRLVMSVFLSVSLSSVPLDF